MSWSERTSQPKKTTSPSTAGAKVMPARVVLPPVPVEMIRVRNRTTGLIREVPKGTLLWLDEIVPDEIPTATAPVVTPLPPVVVTQERSEPVRVERSEPVEAVAPAEVYVQGVHYPYGFDSYQEFIDRTRIIAEQARNGKVIVSGSSVTGHSFKTKKPFHADGHITQNSDIDVGIVDENLYWDEDQVNHRGFPIPRTELGDAELLAGSGMRDKHLQMGIKVWSGDPEDRHFIVRPHTPPPQRRPPVDITSGASHRQINKELNDRRNDKKWKGPK